MYPYNIPSVLSPQTITKGWNFMNHIRLIVLCFFVRYFMSILIILMGKRELVALLNLSSWCIVMIERLFLVVPRGCLQFVIVVFPDHIHLLKIMKGQLSLNAGQKYCKVLQREHSAILLTFIKLPFVIKIFVLSILVIILHKFYCSCELYP